MKSLLEKARAINRLLKKIGGNPVDYEEMSRVLAENLECSVYMIGRRGQLVSCALLEEKLCPDIVKVRDRLDRFPNSFNGDLLDAQETRANIKVEAGICLFKAEGVACPMGHAIITIVPVYGGALRIGTLILAKQSGTFSDDDIVLSEYGSTVVANEFMRVRGERTEEVIRKKTAVQIAVATLSYSEREAIEHIMAELKGNDGLLVASRIADKVGITRSVIVSALRKFESAGVIESRSLGMKGTYIKVLNEFLFDELEKH
ncbi:MAG: GTP-sensing pleiotropic transcriptional regulator CodY [Solirubrobacterales bacterium]